MTERSTPTPPERVYIYELDSEELPPLEVEQEIQEEPLAALHPSDRPGAALEVNDEPLPFEVPALRSGVAAGRQEVRSEAAAQPAAAVRNRKKRVKQSREEPSGGEGSEGGGQGTLGV